MKLNELAAANPTKQAARVFESYFGKGVDFDAISANQAKSMLRRVRALIAEHRRTPEFHSSEQNPAYLKLVVMEQALSAAAMTPAAGSAPQASPQQTAAAMTLQRQQKQRELDDQIKSKQKELADLQKAKGMLETRKSLKQRLKEASEVQQAQVVLASQDMVDQVQKMSEQISAMQFKDLPALVDQIKNEVGTDQAMQFNTDATAALAGLLQNLQGAKTQLEAALGVVTGQAPVVPGADMGADATLGGEMPAELPAPGEEEITATDVDIEEPEEEPIASTLGRGRR
jgi:hypothetical protein